MKIENYFDAVLMLTWSDWENEPRSNRYHYATRFARTVPVLFVQHRDLRRNDIFVEPSGIDNIDIIHVNNGMRTSDVSELKALLAARGIKRPLLWIYDSFHYQELIEALPGAFRVYHATEDYLTKTDGWNQGMDKTANSAIHMLKQVDFMVACTHGVAQSYRTAGGYTGEYVVAENGCDAEYFLDILSNYPAKTQQSEKPVAIFQGGINQRLDYKLLLDLIKKMRDWQFVFCGKAVDSPGWNQILQLKNVQYIGPVAPEEFGARMCAATVGLIPYIQDDWIRNSLPLKAYEYVACGLPVVTVPITALEREVELMPTATTAEEFESVMRRIAKTRYDPKYLSMRKKAALENSYDGRFEQMRERLLQARSKLANARKKLRIAILYDSLHAMQLNTVREHLESFDKYSAHSITYIPATRQFWCADGRDSNDNIDLSVFDVVIVHFSIRLSTRAHLFEPLAAACEVFGGLRVLFIQDEYESTEISRQWMDRLNFNVVYTCVPNKGLPLVYPFYRFPATEFLHTLTGYVPELGGIENYAKPLSERKKFIAYRGWREHAVYGELGQEKYTIGVEMKKNADMRGLPVDIEVDDTRRISGDALYEFLGSARATLGTESGSSVFDFDGWLKIGIERISRANPKISFQEIAERVLAGHEGRVISNQMSPNLFEAIRVRTALVLFEGSYSGVIRPNEHFIPLKKDFSNIDEVIGKLQDDHYLTTLTERAYRDVIESGAYSYQKFVHELDTEFERRMYRFNKEVIVPGPLYTLLPDGSLKQILPALPSGLFSGPHPLGYPKSHAAIGGLIADKDSTTNLPATATAAQNAAGSAGVALAVTESAGETVSSASVAPAVAANPNVAEGSIAYRIVRKIWRLLPKGLRFGFASLLRKAVKRLALAKQNRSPLFWIARTLWRLIPAFIRQRVSSRLAGSLLSEWR